MPKEFAVKVSAISIKMEPNESTFSEATKKMVSQAICSPPEPCHSKKSPLNIVYMINIDTSGPRPDISGPHPGLRAKFLLSQAIWSPPEPSQSKKLQINVV